MKKIIALPMLLLGALVLSGCGSSGSQNAPYGTPGNTNYNSAPVTKPVPTPVTPQEAPVATNNISIQNFAFSPSSLTIKKGTTVTWTNNDSVVHTIKSAAFNSGDLAKGATFKFTFDTVGTFDYSCGIHPSMMGKIIVQ